MNVTSTENFNLFFCTYACMGICMNCGLVFLFSTQSWLEAIEDHSAYSTHYCTQEQLSSDDEDDAVPVTYLQDTLKVCTEFGSCI